MPGRPKPTPIEVFEANLADAARLVMLTRVLLNTRKRRMRQELRDSVGSAIKVPRKRRHALDCVESDDVFVVLKPGGVAQREHFTEPELRPLLRQAIVAISAAVESYVAEKACCYIGEALRADERPTRLVDMPITLGDALWVHESFRRRGWGYRTLIEEHIEAEASPDPAKIGKVFATVGKRDVFKRVDSQRKVAKGTSERQLKALYDRRNLIAHTGDRTGRGRASLSLDEVEAHFANAKDVIEALEAVL